MKTSGMGTHDGGDDGGRESPSSSSCTRTISHQHHSRGSRRSLEASRARRLCLSSPSLFLTLALIVTLCCTSTIASPLEAFLYEGLLVEAPPSSPLFQHLHSSPNPNVGSAAPAIPQFAQTGTILVDQDPQPHLQVPDSHHDFARRQTNSGPTATSPSSTTATTSASSAATSSLSATPLPTVWDTGIGSNYTVSACPNFINGFLQSTAFKACLPFSMLIESSVSFFRAEQSLVRITQVLDASCAASVTTCTALMNNIASNLTSTCSADYALQNPVVAQMRTGLLAYQNLYTASCMKSPTTSNYCFADAITNASSPTDSYIYFLPIGQPLVGGTNPSCNVCLQESMTVFNAQSANRSQAIAGTYGDAAKLVNSICGPGFVNATLPAALVGSGALRTFLIGKGWITVVFGVIAWGLI